MGKRKSARKPVARVKLLLDKQFTCHFCNHEKSIECKLDREHMIGTLSCRMCGVQWQTNIHNLTEPIDIYSDWIDACESERAKARNRAPEEPRELLGASVPSVPARGHVRKQPSSNKEASRKPERRREEYEDETEDEEEDDFVARDDDDVSALSEEEEEAQFTESEEEQEDSGKAEKLKKSLKLTRQVSAEDEESDGGDDEAAVDIDQARKKRRMETTVVSSDEEDEA